MSDDKPKRYINQLQDQRDELLAILTEPLASANGGMTAPELLRWMAERIVRVMGEDPRLGYVRALRELAERMELVLAEVGASKND